MYFLNKKYNNTDLYKKIITVNGYIFSIRSTTITKSFLDQDSKLIEIGRRKFYDNIMSACVYNSIIVLISTGKILFVDDDLNLIREYNIGDISYFYSCIFKDNLVLADIHGKFLFFSIQKDCKLTESFTTNLDEIIFDVKGSSKFNIFYVLTKNKICVYEYLDYLITVRFEYHDEIYKFDATDDLELYLFTRSHIIKFERYKEVYRTSFSGFVAGSCAYKNVILIVTDEGDLSLVFREEIVYLGNTEPCKDIHYSSGYLYVLGLKSPNKIFLIDLDGMIEDLQSGNVENYCIFSKNSDLNTNIKRDDHKIITKVDTFQGKNTINKPKFIWDSHSLYSSSALIKKSNLSFYFCDNNCLKKLVKNIDMVKLDGVKHNTLTPLYRSFVSIDGQIKRLSTNSDLLNIEDTNFHELFDLRERCSEVFENENFIFLMVDKQCHIYNKKTGCVKNYENIIEFKVFNNEIFFRKDKVVSKLEDSTEKPIMNLENQNFTVYGNFLYQFSHKHFRVFDIAEKKQVFLQKIDFEIIDILVKKTNMFIVCKDRLFISTHKKGIPSVFISISTDMILFHNEFCVVYRNYLIVLEDLRKFKHSFNEEIMDIDVLKPFKDRFYVVLKDRIEYLKINFEKYVLKKILSDNRLRIYGEYLLRQDENEFTLEKFSDSETEFACSGLCIFIIDGLLDCSLGAISSVKVVDSELSNTEILYFFNLYRENECIFQYRLDGRVYSVEGRNKYIFIGYKDSILAYEIGIKGLLKKYRIDLDNIPLKIKYHNNLLYVSVKESSIIVFDRTEFVLNDPIFREIHEFELFDDKIVAIDMFGNIYILQVHNKHLKTIGSLFINDKVLKFYINDGNIYYSTITGCVGQVYSVDENNFKILIEIESIFKEKTKYFNKIFSRLNFTEFEYLKNIFSGDFLALTDRIGIDNLEKILRFFLNS